MKIHTYIISISAGLLLSLAGCSDDTAVKEVSSETQEINLSGIMTKATGSSNLFIKAYYPGPFDVYFNETPVSVAGGLEVGVEKDITFSGSTPYYPLGGGEIRLFGFTGRLYDGDKMVLNSGSADVNDAVLSNYGRRRGDPAVDPGYAPIGTPGNSSVPAELLQFRHVMTQINVNIEIDNTETPPVDPEPTHVSLGMAEIFSLGHYPIRAMEPDPANETGADVATPVGTARYNLQLGVNYVIPTGVDLVGKRLTHLVIDDYIATAQDLTGFTVFSTDPATPNMRLLPGYSYNLTLTVSRLQIRSIALSRVQWITHPVDAQVSYDPYVLELSLGGNYTNQGDDAVTKVALHSNDNRIYVGKVSEDDPNRFEFVTLPAAGAVEHADIYTDKGLLISTDITPESFQGTTLNLILSEAGMLTENPGQPYGPDNPYMITTPVQFMNVAKDLSGHYKQAATIDLSNLNLIGSDRIFNGFGDFSGTYDGNNNRIDELDIEGPGLFSTNNGTLRNIRIFSGTMDASGQTYAGSICGTNNGTIVGCFNESRLADGTGTVGGICGLNGTNGRVIACLNTGTVLQGNIVGGIVGTNNNTSEGAVSACINTGMLNPSAATLGVIIGSNPATNNNVVRASFGLVGSAQRTLGGVELIIGSDNANAFDSSVLYPEILRNGLLPGETEDRRVVNRLNSEIATTPWAGIYEYIYDREITGSTWPVPMKVN